MVVTAKRFIIGSISGPNKPINFFSLRKSIETMIHDLWGIIGRLNLRFMSISKERIAAKKTTLVIIECNRKAARQILTALLLIDKLDGKDMRWNTLHVAGSERQKKQFIVKFSK